MPGRSIVMAAFTGFWLPITIDPHPMMIFFNYLYRDAGNYKQHGSVVFGNPNNRRLNEVDQRIRAALIDGEFFVARHWGLPDLRGDECDDELDHDWHEFEVVEETEDGGGAHQSIDVFLDRILRKPRVF